MTNFPLSLLICLDIYISITIANFKEYNKNIATQLCTTLPTLVITEKLESRQKFILLLCLVIMLPYCCYSEYSKKKSVSYLPVPDKPHNPMINAGAIVVTSLLKPKLQMADRFDFVSPN